jgi:hypothetical protein
MARTFVVRSILLIFALAITQLSVSQTVVQNPSSTQTINQPSGTTFTVNGVQTLLWPNIFRIANEGNSMVFRDMSQTDAWFMVMKNDGNSTGDIQFFGNFTHGGSITPNPANTGSIGTASSPWQTGFINFLSKAAGQFRIDHPLDPLHKVLQHSFVESPDMKNIYDGIAVLDTNGEMWITLPDWFQALNSDYRYQLTAIGMPASGLYIAKELSANKFKIAGGKPNMKVSWQVTGIRQDSYAKAHRIQVEETKPPELQGKYLYPEGFDRQDGDRIAKTQNATGDRSTSQASPAAANESEGNQHQLH